MEPLKLTQQLSLPILWRCYRYLRPYRDVVGGAYLFVLAITALDVAIPQFIRLIVDRGIAARDTTLLGRMVLVLLALTMLKGLFTFLQGKWVEVASQRVAYSLRNELQNRLTELPFSYHDRTEAGQLLSRALQDVEYVRFLTGRALLRIVEAILLFAATGAVLLWMNPRLALLALLTLPLIIWVGARFGMRYRPLSQAIQEQLGVLTTRLEQNLRGARVVKAFAREEAEIERFEAQNRRWFELSARAARLEAFNMPLIDMLANLSLVAVVWYGGLLVMGEQVTLGELVAFTTYLGQLANPVRRLGIIIPALAMASTAAARIFAILDVESEVQDAAGARPLVVKEGVVRFEDVAFAYDDGHPVLQGIEFTAAPGAVVALVGATGAGKSTIINLLLRFYDPTAGRVLVDGQDIRNVTLRSLRRQIGVVLQETTLFAGTVRDNLAYGRPAAGEAAIVAAAQAAQAHDFIMTQLPHGYDTVVGEQGTTLSGGQKQRLAIARALLTDPRILVLDDATASVDTETERLIQQALVRLMAGRTTFTIAHRLSTVQRADVILLLHRGRIVARGRHEELMRRSSRYRDICAHQLRPQAAAASLTAKESER